MSERVLHFIDLEYFFSDDAKRSYADDLSHKPSFKDIPRDMSDSRWQRAGMLPFRVEQCYRQLVTEMRAGRLLDTPGQYPRDENAVKWAGMLAHYAEDNTQPQHATADYKSQSYFKDKLRGPNVHADMEYVLVDGEYNDYRALREEFWTELQTALAELHDPIQTISTIRGAGNGGGVACQLRCPAADRPRRPGGVYTHGLFMEIRCGEVLSLQGNCRREGNDRAPDESPADGVGSGHQTRCSGCAARSMGRGAPGGRVEPKDRRSHVPVVVGPF